MDHGHMLPVRVFMNVHHRVSQSQRALAEPLALLQLCAQSHINSGVRNG
jgi:hypothetical protein